MDSGAGHHGWAAEQDRQPIEALLNRGSEVSLRVSWVAKKGGERWDTKLGAQRTIIHGRGRCFTVQIVDLSGDTTESGEGEL